MKKLSPLIRTIISISVLAIVLKKTGTKDVLAMLGSMHLVYFFISMLIFIFIIFFGSIRWRLILSVDGNSDGVGAFRLFLLNFMGFFFNFVLPGMVSGDAVKGYYYFKETGKAALSASSVFADRYLGLVALITLGLAALPFGMDRIRGTGAEWAIPAVAIILVSVSLFILFFRAGRRFKLVRDIYSYFEKIKKSPGIIMKAFLYSIFMHMMTITSVYIISIGIGAGIPLLEFFLFMPIINTIAAIPVSISGLGLREGAFVVLFGLLGTTPEIAISISLGWYLSCMAGSLPGLFIYAVWKGKG